MKKSILISMLFLSVIGAFAQGNNEEKSWIEKAKTLNEAENYRGSLNAYLKAYKLNPKNAETVYQIAWTYNDLDVYDTAIIYANKGILLDAKDL